MNFAWFLMVLLGIFASSFSSNTDADDRRVKRAVWQFGYLINRYTRWSALDYNGYGCWCGKGGKGRPKDATDRCCRTHDRCYNRLIYTRRICRRNEVYYKSYYHSGLRCIRSVSWWLPRVTACGLGLCRCDVAAVRCFRRTSGSFNKRYKNYNKNSC